MKKLLLLTMILASFVSNGQVKQVVSKVSSIANPVKLAYEKDEFTGKEYLFTETYLLVTNDGKKGFKIYTTFKKDGENWIYNGISGMSTIGSCFENDKIYIIFDDGSKFDMTSWRDFNCKGNISFDLYGKYKDDLSKPMKGIKFQNGRDFTSFDKIFTSENDKNYFINAFKALDDYNSSH
jgi:hypothetical protein